MECMELKVCMSGKHHRYYEHTKFRQNPRGDPKFLVDLTRNDPIVILHIYLYQHATLTGLVEHSGVLF